MTSSWQLSRLEVELAIDGSRWADSRRSDARPARGMRAHVRAYVDELNADARSVRA